LQQSIGNGTAHDRHCEKLMPGLVLVTDNNRHLAEVEICDLVAPDRSLKTFIG